jgi:hypothetical protein
VLLSVDSYGSTDCSPVTEVPETRIAHTVLGRIAYQVVGDGPIDVNASAIAAASPCLRGCPGGTDSVGERDRCSSLASGHQSRR